MLLLHIFFGLAIYPVMEWLARQPHPENNGLTRLAGVIPWVVGIVWVIIGSIWVNSLGVMPERDAPETAASELGMLYYILWIIGVIVLTGKGLTEGQRTKAIREAQANEHPHD